MSSLLEQEKLNHLCVLLAEDSEFTELCNIFYGRDDMDYNSTEIKKVIENLIQTCATNFLVSESQINTIDNVTGRSYLKYLLYSGKILDILCDKKHKLTAEINSTVSYLPLTNEFDLVTPRLSLVYTTTLAALRSSFPKIELRFAPVPLNSKIKGLNSNQLGSSLVTNSMIRVWTVTVLPATMEAKLFEDVTVRIDTINQKTITDGIKKALKAEKFID